MNMIVGLDLAKQVFHCVDQHGKRKKLKRANLLKHFANLQALTIAMEACSSAHYWARELIKLGHKPLLLPPQHVKGYLRGQKNDFNDAAAIQEAAQHGRVRAVPVKSIEDQDKQALLNKRKMLVAERTRQANQLRGLLCEYGIVIPIGVHVLQKQIPEILEDAENGLTVIGRQLIARSYQQLQQLNEELDWFTKQIETQAKQDEACQRLQAVPGIGPIVSYAFKCWIGDGKQFKQGRDASAAIGLVPRQHSSGDKPRMLGISKRGDGYLRSLLIHGARAVVRQAGKKTDSLSRWINRLIETRGFNKAAVALANKLVRIAWVIVARQEGYQPQTI